MPNNPEDFAGRLPRRAEGLMPHSGPMCMIDEITVISEDFAETSATVKADSPFLRRDGTIEDCIFVEMIAQSMAARSGFDLTEEKLKNQKGYLLGIKKMKISGTARAGDKLRIRFSKTGQYGDFTIIEGIVFKGETILAQGELKVIQMIGQSPIAGAE